MLNFQNIDVNKFLLEYWQKKPLLIPNALPGFKNPIHADDLAGLALEEEIESRIVLQTPDKSPYWHLKRGPFKEKDFKKLPQKHWTLLVQGVDRFIPEVNALLDYFNFIPQWRFDDVMISYAVEQGGVGPHYDHYDVFLYQAQGRRKWSLTSHHCNPENYLTDVPLRIMKQFDTEEDYILEEGDMLYLPPKIGHNGVALSADCMTYSFGYRSYRTQELWDNLGEHLALEGAFPGLYKDPSWINLSGINVIPKEAVANAKSLLQGILDDETALQNWFGCFATRLDEQAEALILASEERKNSGVKAFLTHLQKKKKLIRNPLCRLAYFESPLRLFINGECWPIEGIPLDLLRLVADNRVISDEKLTPFLNHPVLQSFLYKLWVLQYLE